MLQVGINTYIDRKYIDGFISAFHPGEANDFWEALEEAHKEYYLFLSQATVDSQRFRGMRAFRGQKLEFPRIERGQNQRPLWAWRWKLVEIDEPDDVDIPDDIDPDDISTQIPIEPTIDSDTGDFIDDQDYEEDLLASPSVSIAQVDGVAPQKKWVKRLVRVVRDWNDVIPNYVKAAQAEVLIALLPLAKNKQSQNIADKLAKGLTGFSLDGFSETYGNAVAGELDLATLSPRAHTLLNKWLKGSFSVL